MASDKGKAESDYSWVGTALFLLFMFFALWVSFKDSQKKGEERLAIEAEYCERVYSDGGSEIYYRRDLRALVDSSSYQGSFQSSFFVSRGNFESVYTYTFIEVLEDGGRFLREVDANQAVLYEDVPAGQTPWVELRGTSSISCEYKYPEAIRFPRNGWYEIHVPFGSVVSSYEIDLE